MGFKLSFDLLFKLGLLALGFADFFGLLPDALDILDKGLTAAVLAYFWYELKLSKFLFGTRVRWLDGTILTAFYILVIDSFIQVIRVIDLNGQLASDAAYLTTVIPGLSVVKSAFLFVYNPANAASISLLSAIIGFSLLIIVAVYAATKLTYTRVSVMHSFARLFIHTKKNWIKFSNTTGTSRITKFVLSVLVLFSIYQYFFALVNQWFIISLDKALLIVAIVYAAKDIKGTKSKALNTLGRFDDILLNGIRDIFTNHKKFYLGFGILLVFHYLSDLATFFLPYFISSLSIDPFYLNFIGDSAGTFHQPLSALVASSSHGLGMYILSSLGSLVMILFPMLFLYLVITEKPLHEFTKKYWHRVITAILFVLSVSFSIYNWVTQKTIRVAGIQGVDFTTHTISGNLLFGFGLMVLLFVGLLFMIRSRKAADHLLIATYLFSFSYFGYYVWNYFLSSWFYHKGILAVFFSSGHIFLGIIFILLFALEILFYLGGFILLTFESSKLVTRDLAHLSTRAAFAWTLAIILIPLLIMASATVTAFTLATTTLVVLLLFSYALFKHYTGKEKRDDYMFGLTITIMIYQIIVVARLLLQGAFSVEGLIMFESILLVGLALVAKKLLGIKLQLGTIKLPKLLLVLLAGFGFSIVFFIANEPVPALTTFIGALLFTLLVAVAEELLFRGVVFSLARQAFTNTQALHLQAVFFGLIHVVGIGVLLRHFSQSTHLLGLGPYAALILYGVCLYLFSLVAGRLALYKNKVILVYAIIFHWAVNLLTYTIF